MNKEKYQKLNNYLNIICKKLQEKDFFFLEKFYNFCYFSTNYKTITKDYELKENWEQENLSYEEVLLLAREIIESIDKSYLTKFDGLISSGVIDFNYNEDLIEPDKTSGSWCITRKNITTIDIDRKFTYRDIIVVIHEFMHYTNSVPTFSNNKYVLTEFISIFFERYAQKYLIEKYNVSLDKIGYYDRLSSMRKSSHNFELICLPILSFLTFGSLNENSYVDLNKYFLYVSKEDYEKEIDNLLNKIEKINKQFDEDFLISDKNEDKRAIYLIKNLGLIIYKYQFGLQLCFYLKDKIDLETMVSFNNNINSELSKKISVYEYFKLYNIDLNNMKVYECINLIEEELKKYVKTR